ncbi:MAG: hypothetical protein AAB368_06025 [bacterium]
MTVPIIRLEAAQMKHAIQAALHEHAVQMDEMVHAALEAFCAPANINRVVRDEADRTIKHVEEEEEEEEEEEVREFFARGNGRAALRAAILERLNAGG